MNEILNLIRDCHPWHENLSVSRAGKTVMTIEVSEHGKLYTYCVISTTYYSYLYLEILDELKGNLSPEIRRFSSLDALKEYLRNY